MSVLLGTVLFATASVLSIRSTRIINLRHHSAAWPKISATIIHPEVREETDNEGTSFRPEISFSYSISGRTFTSKRHTEGMPLIHSQSAALQMVARYPANSVVIASVKPDDPSFAELRKIGANGCVLVGDPAFYIRFGFANNPALVLEGVPQAFILSLSLGTAFAHGNVQFHPAFQAKD